MRVVFFSTQSYDRSSFVDANRKHAHELVFSGTTAERGFGCRVLAIDPIRSPECEATGATYVSFPEILAESDIITLHCPLVPDTYHLIGSDAVGRMKRGVMLINTSRGALIDTRGVIDGLKSGAIGYLGFRNVEQHAPCHRAVRHSPNGVDSRAGFRQRR